MCGSTQASLPYYGIQCVGAAHRDVLVPVVDELAEVVECAEVEEGQAEGDDGGAVLTWQGGCWCSQVVLGEGHCIQQGLWWWWWGGGQKWGGGRIGVWEGGGGRAPGGEWRRSLLRHAAFANVSLNILSVGKESRHIAGALVSKACPTLTQKNIVNSHNHMRAHLCACECVLRAYDVVEAVQLL
jgi:hypothetical protein